MSNCIKISSANERLMFDSPVVRRDTVTRQHTLRLGLLTLGGQAMQSMELREVALPHLRHVVERTRLGAHLAILDHGAAVYNDDYFPTVGQIVRTAALKLSSQLGSHRKR